MCGITGLWHRTNATAPQGQADLEATVTAMAATLAVRGPDDAASWCDADAGLALGFRRLAIVDLTTAGRQPMQSASGRTVIVFNGEIYNAEDMRQELAGRQIHWRGHSDTEVLLEAIEAWGLTAALQRTNGMFALGLWDRAERTLTLARDRLGKKPLYWSDRNGLVLFGSQPRALMAHPAFDRQLDRNALCAYLRHNAMPSPHTVFAGMRQVAPGHLVRITANGQPLIMAWWRLADVVTDARPFRGTLTDASHALETVLGDAVKQRMIADVPLGAFLSGGIDSSAVVALMQKQSSRPVKTFTIGYHEPAFDESTYAADVARHLGTDHTSLMIEPADALALVPRLPDIYDEPFADASQIPTLLVSQLARTQVTVALSGDGGDELFAGYNRYLEADRFRRLVATTPKALRSGLATGMAGIAPAQWDRLFALLPERHRPRAAGDKMHKLSDVLAEDGDGFYRKLTSGWSDPHALIPGGVEPMTAAGDPAIAALVPDFIARMQYRDTLTYLPDDILTKVDRASMAMSLEARNPLLDHRVVSFAWSLPQAYKLQGRVGKRVLRSVLARHVPDGLINRPKMGFGIPIDRWLRGPLRDWAEDLLSEQSLRYGGVFAPAPIRQRWTEHLSERRNWQSSLWTVLMFQAWQRHWRVG
jgi:asparagine synthase (glutamine-hydrolysing)